MDAAGGEIGGDAEEWLRQFLDPDIAEMLHEHGDGLPSAPQSQGDHREGEIIERIVGDEDLRMRSVSSATSHSWARPAAMIAPIDVPPR